MTLLHPMLPACLCAVLCALAGAARADDGLCREQAAQVIERLEAEVVGTLDANQREAANNIVLDVCEARESTVQAEVEAAVTQAREEERAAEAAPPDKAGNRRLKRRGSF